MRYAVLISALLFFILTAAAQDGRTVNQTQFPPTYIPSGQEMYKQFCAACHGADGKGDGPAASNLKTRPADLTTLAKRHDGKFPYDYVSTMLRFGPGVPAHGSSNMPTWGPIFSIIEKSNEKAVQERIRRLSAYLASLQEK
jgi:mono/diheme cytochrome c family protein